MIGSLSRDNLEELIPFLTDEDKKELIELIKGDIGNFREMIPKMFPGYKFYRYSEILIEYLQYLADGDIKRLMIFMPPRMGKSELASKLFPAYLVARDPDKWVALCSYSADLAYVMSRAAKQYYTYLSGTPLSRVAHGVKVWQPERARGGFWCAGVAGSLTGRGFDVGIIDDPLKNHIEAMSDDVREKHKLWWESTFYQRGEKNSAIAIIMTRWHEADLAGWLLDQEKKGEDIQNWTVISFPMIKPKKYIQFPKTCVVVKDWRKPGELLCPERADAERVGVLKSVGGGEDGYFWNAIHQQMPTNIAGNIFKKHWWKYWMDRGDDYSSVFVNDEKGDGKLVDPIHLPINFDEVIQSWDLNLKDKGTSDQVCGQVWGLHQANFYLIFQVVGIWGLTETLQQIRLLSRAYPSSSAIYIEDKANGPAVMQILEGELPGIIPVQPYGNKISRARASSHFVQAGSVYIPHPDKFEWVEGFINELAEFPNGAYDDQVDSASQAMRELNEFALVDVGNLGQELNNLGQELNNNGNG